MSNCIWKLINHLSIPYFYYIPVILLPQMQASHAGEIQHDGIKIPVYTQWNTVPNMVWWRITPANYFPNFIFMQHSKNHEAGGECVISLFLEMHIYFQWAKISYIHVHVSIIYNPCVDRLTNIFYGVILTPKQTIQIIINSMPIIIEKDYNYNAVSTASDEYFFSHSAKGKAHSVLVSEMDSEYLNLSPVFLLIQSCCIVL